MRRTTIFVAVIAAIVMLAGACGRRIDSDGFSASSNRVAADNIATVAGMMQVRLHDGQLAGVAGANKWMVTPDVSMAYSSIYWEVLDQRATAPGTIRYEIVSFWRGNLERWVQVEEPATWGRACGIVTVDLLTPPEESTSISEPIECPAGVAPRPAHVPQWR